MGTITSKAIYVFWSPSGDLPDFVLRTLKQLQQICSQVVLVVNGSLNDVQYRDIPKEVTIIIRPNEGYDFFGYREGIRHIDFSELDQLILCNSSCYDPLITLGSIFQIMKPKNLDFWGMTQYYNGSWPDHIQSYFYVFNKRILKDSRFKRYWEDLPRVRNRDEAIICLETRLTKEFESWGYRWDTVVPVQAFYPEYSECTMTNFLELIQKKNLPLLKRKAAYFLKSYQYERYESLLKVLESQGYDTTCIKQDCSKIGINLKDKTQISKFKDYLKNSKFRKTIVSILKFFHNLKYYFILFSIKHKL